MIDMLVYQQAGQPVERLESGAGRAAAELSEQLTCVAKKYGYLDSTIERFSGKKVEHHRFGVYKMVDTCAAELYGTDPILLLDLRRGERGSGIHRRAQLGEEESSWYSAPVLIRIGQGIEFDYCLGTLRMGAERMPGYEAVIVNNNPETVSTDFDTADRLYFDPLTPEDVGAHRAGKRKTMAVLSLQFGGQTAIKLDQLPLEEGCSAFWEPAQTRSTRRRTANVLTSCWSRLRHPASKG